jgi:hypothetical protein
MTATKWTNEVIAYQIGFQEAERMISWDLYLSPRDTWFEAKNSYTLDEDEYKDFERGVIDAVNKV